MLQSSINIQGVTGLLSLALAASVASVAYFASSGSNANTEDFVSTSSIVDLGQTKSNGETPYPAQIPYTTSTQDLNVVPDATKRVLVLDQDELYTGTIFEDKPFWKEPDDRGRKLLLEMTPEQATQELRKNEESWFVDRGTGVVRYDVVQIPSNDPIEDDHAEKIIEVQKDSPIMKSIGDWMFWGVFDGHGGWITSSTLRQTLISYVARELNELYKSLSMSSSSSIPSQEAINQAIKTGFLKLDHEIVHESVNKVNETRSKRVAAELLAPALAGSCALLSFYDSRSNLLRVACTGDSRAVLGRRGENGKWTATALSIDQTGANEEEAARLRREHPGEPQVTKNGRILGGLEPSRAFGDAIYKWSLATQARIEKLYFGRSASALKKTPPYVTAEPVVTTTKIEPDKNDFLVLATDGLWEMLTNEEVVGLVGQWLDTQTQKKIGGRLDHWLKSWVKSSSFLPVERRVDDGCRKDVPIRQKQWGMAGHNDRFVVEDNNAATHLVRNALGGRDKEHVCALLTLPSPYSRRYRDDLTVEVIFFGKGEHSGKVSLNLEASSPAFSSFKAKL